MDSIMDDFQLSPELDNDKVFLIKHSELEGRLDPIMAVYNRKTTQYKCKTEPLSNLLKLKPQYGANEIGIERRSDDEPRYIRITDIDEYGVLKQETGKTAKTVEAKYILQNNDLLFARSGATVGKAYIHKTKETIYPCFYAGYMIKFVVNEQKIIPDYVFVFTQLETYKEWVAAIQRTAAQPNINAEEYKSLIIPIPPKEIQAKIVAKMDIAHVDKKQKDAEAQRLSDSIDDYLLGELGVKFPNQKENTVQNRMFERQFSEVTGKRFDAPFHQQKYNLESDKFPMDELRNCVFINPTTSFIGLPLDTLATFIPMEKISDLYGEADISNCRTLAESEGYTKFQDNDLLWAKITPCMQNGKSAVVSNLKNGIGFGSTEYHVFRAKPEIDIRYIHSLLRLRSLRDHAVLYFSGSAGQQRVSDRLFKTLSIPKPSIKKQTEIANHIDEIRNQARQLQKQAKAELERAKKEVEMMILGEAKCKA